MVDPHDHHLFVSLGCATENLVQAALANGLRGDAQFDPIDAGAITVSLQATRAISSPLFQAVAERQCTRGDFDGKQLTAAELRLLEKAGTGNGVRMLLLTERPALEKVLEYVVSGNTTQMNDPAFVDELKAWIRFGADEAACTGDGLHAGAAGNPSLPRWLGSRVMGLSFTPKSENERYARQIHDAAGIAVFASDASNKAHWIEAGRCHERFALQATALGIRNALYESTGRGRVDPAAVRFGDGTRRPAPRSGGPFRSRPHDAAIPAAADSGGAGTGRRHIEDRVH